LGASPSREGGVCGPAHLGRGVEVRINGVVHLRTDLPAETVVPIGWVAVGRPFVILPPEKHAEIWAIQKTLDFPGFVYGVSRVAAKNMPGLTKITELRSRQLGRHRDDDVVRPSELRG
jgi:hypothetical protein